MEDNMLPFERKQKILDLLKTKKSLSVEGLTKLLYSSPAIRRDLAELSQEGLIRRIRGGATYIENKSVDLPYDFRKVSESEKKKYIAKIALDFVYHDMTLFMDSSTTVLQMVPFLKEYKGLKILTNGTITAQQLSQYTNAEVTCVGGRVHPKSSSINGAVASDFITHYRADLALMSGKSLCESGAMEYTEEEAIVRRAYVKYAKEKVVLIDSTKFGGSCFYQSIPFSHMDYLISDGPISPSIREQVDRYNVEFIY